MDKKRWTEDTMILVTRSTRAKLKLKAIKVGLTLKDYLERIAKGKDLEATKG